MVLLGIFLITKLLVTINDIHESHLSIGELGRAEKRESTILIDPGIFLKVIKAALETDYGLPQLTFLQIKGSLAVPFGYKHFEIDGEQEIKRNTH
jgi:hypothetical protein